MTPENMRGSALSLPDVTDKDIANAERWLGVAFDDERRGILSSNESFDVQACPGSGKTTVLVAKLAILASNWVRPHRGICVLSHTNVAREEIRTRLGGTTVGQRLLEYPHFVGTIHSFVNEFLALPLLRSEGRTVRLIDAEGSAERCRALLSRKEYVKAKTFLDNKDRYGVVINSLRYDGPGLELRYARGELPCGAASPSFMQLAEIKKRVVAMGVWCHDDMFAIAEKLLAEYPGVAEFVRWRFPVVLLDEMQDTSELQSRVLSALFPPAKCRMRQRFGDRNQAIYEGGHEQASSDPFPGHPIRALSSSRRFGQSIASKAESMAPDPPSPFLSASGPRATTFPVPLAESCMPHSIFLFEAGSTGAVLPTFGSLLLKAFPDEVLLAPGFVARAIGRVGQRASDAAVLPGHLGDYWAEYAPRLARQELNPETLADHIHLARMRMVTVDRADATRTVRRGLSKLLECLELDSGAANGNAFRAVFGAASEDPDALGMLRGLLWRWCVDGEPVGESDWAQQIGQLKRGLQPLTGGGWSDEAERFCKWSSGVRATALERTASLDARPNRYQYRDGDRAVSVDLGTIHGAKGQTHTATLVLETYFRRHDLSDLLPWLLGEKRGARANEGKERTERMRLIYTAMTRPSHLLCLAIRKEAMGEGDRHQENVARLQRAGWSIQIL